MPYLELRKFKGNREAKTANEKPIFFFPKQVWMKNRVQTCKEMSRKFFFFQGLGIVRELLLFFFFVREKWNFAKKLSEKCQGILHFRCIKLGYLVPITVHSYNFRLWYCQGNLNALQWNVTEFCSILIVWTLKKTHQQTNRKQQHQAYEEFLCRVCLPWPKPIKCPSSDLLQVNSLIAVRQVKKLSERCFCEENCYRLPDWYTEMIKYHAPWSGEKVLCQI